MKMDTLSEKHVCVNINLLLTFEVSAFAPSHAVIAIYKHDYIMAYGHNTYRSVGARGWEECHGYQMQ